MLLRCCDNAGNVVVTMTSIHCLPHFLIFGVAAICVWRMPCRVMSFFLMQSFLWGVLFIWNRILVHLSWRLSSVHPSSLTFHILDFFSETTKRNSTKLDRNKILTSSVKFLFLWPIRKTRWLPWPPICWNIFDFSSETAGRNSTKLDAEQDLNVLPVCVFFGPIKKTQYDRHGLWLAEIFFASPVNLLNGIQWNLTGSKTSASSTEFVFFGLTGKPRWPPGPLIGWINLKYYQH